MSHFMLLSVTGELPFPIICDKDEMTICIMYCLAAANTNWINSPITECVSHFLE